MARTKTEQIVTTVADGAADKALFLSRVNGVASARGVYYTQASGIEIHGASVGFTGTATWVALSAANKTVVQNFLNALWAERATADGFV